MNRMKKMAKILQFFKDDKLYGECPDCGCDTFLLLMTEDDEIKGSECCDCREEYIFEETGISFELDDDE